ncbi:hypothetical protein BAAM0483_07460 [Bifidobacterium animalis subsp. animalis MCC 0483]|uniref:Uncharacterized protein n=1 Tax=Bifidobacterium animalis subsp. animalis MCC 0483 TaxID=1365955 RepID=A0AB34T837_9BIFI|nr:hypothetical protein BAAM0483_07460 [Bifidobacterium animalis subsp. animalis MCC 0483]KOA55116.1 hypothetical protein BAAA27672_03240 [Bifidobacterium animalis subsp. animalis ATCC 27672]
MRGRGVKNASSFVFRANTDGMAVFAKGEI